MSPISRHERVCGHEIIIPDFGAFRCQKEKHKGEHEHIRDGYRWGGKGKRLVRISWPEVKE